MVYYSTNWMGPISTEWCEEHGHDWACGRIDIYDPMDMTGFGSEYSLPPIDTNSWRLLTDWLDDFSSKETISFDELIDTFEAQTGHSITWLNGRRRG